ncbi:P-loop containing nucleoside triphosphate hydrolase protein [Naviculisporaceae sp. PSN 640]
MGHNECPHDYHLKPIFHTCRGVHDFSLKFEKIFLAIVPTSLFILFAIARFLYLVRKPKIVTGFTFRAVKIAAFLALAALQLSLVPFFARDHHGPLRNLALAAKILDVIVALCLGALSAVEHSASPHPSSALNFYHVTSILADVLHIRTSWLMVGDPTQIISSRVSIATILVKTLCFVLENWSKSKWFQFHAHHRSPEEFSSIFSRGLFVWLNPLLCAGYRNVLKVHNLHPLDEDLSAERAQSWTPTQSQLKDGNVYTMGWHLVRHLGISFLLPVLPRIAQSGFYYAQPLFARALLEHLQAPEHHASAVVGHGLIAAGVLLHVGVTLSHAWYGYYVTRFKTKIRSALCTAIYRKLSDTKPVAGTGEDDGTQVVTLMSADVERTSEGLVLLHELWAVPLEIAIGLWILYRELGVAFVASVLIAAVCGFSSGGLARLARKHQRALMSALQTRITLTAGVIDNIMSLHMTGITASLPGLVNAARSVELAEAIRWNLYTLLTSLLGYVPLTITPVITFALTSSTLDVPTIYASLSTMSILCYPLILICQLFPTLQASLTSLKRIQTYLASDSRRETRQITPLAFGPAVSIRNGFFGWSSGKMVLANVNVSIPAQQITMITGPVASGKSTLCKAIIGETPVAGGEAIVRSEYSGIGFCDQTPFLTNTTVAQAIVGHSHLDHDRFNEVVWATKLDEDIKLFPKDRNTPIGPSGNMLSGGQKQRLSLARALYLETDILIVDDIFSALDADTDAQVFDRVFGPDGVVRRRGVTAIVCTNSPQRFRWADNLLTLSDDGVIVSSSSDAGEDEKVRFSTAETVLAPFPEEEEKARSSLEVQHSIETSQLVNTVTEGDSESARQQTNLSAYRLYAKCTGTWPLVLIFVAGLLFACLQNGATYWTTLWSQDRLQKPLQFYLILFALFQCSMLLSALVEGVVYQVTVVRRAGTKFHQKAVAALLAAPMSLFTSKEKGTILNLFSKDMRVINEDIPGSATRACHKAIQVLVMAGMISLATPLLATSYPVLVLVVFLVQRVFLRTSRQMNLLDLELRGPLNTHVLDTINGMATIRAFGWTPSQIQYNNRLLNTSQRAAYLLDMLQQWLFMALKMLCSVVGIAVIALATQLRANAALTGASLVTLTLFSLVLTGFVRSFTNLEIRMGSVNRLKAFCEDNSSPDESTDDTADPSWPRSGGIEFTGVSASYANNDRGHAEDETPLAINDLTLSVRPGEKLAICGRTGSGKTSIVLLLLRLLDPLPSDAAKILIDDTPLSQIDGSTLRRGIIAVPQDPVFLPAGTTVKQNLDPFDEASEEECMAVLNMMGLARVAQIISGPLGLANEMRAESLSAGEQRLFALARAVLRCRVRNRNLLKLGWLPGGIILLDEISFASDAYTQRIIRSVIEDEFKNYTVVMVSHQLRLVDELFTRVIVMEEGRMVEMGDPRELKDRVGGSYAQLWNTYTGANDEEAE